MKVVAFTETNFSKVNMVATLKESILSKFDDASVANILRYVVCDIHARLFSQEFACLRVPFLQRVDSTTHWMT